MRIALLLLFCLAACAAPGDEEAGPPPPANYKAIIAASLQSTDGKATRFYRHVQISDPQPGRVQFVPGWRVCVRDDAMVYRSFFFSGGQLSRVVDREPLCNGYTYQPWPEMEGSAG